MSRGRRAWAIIALPLISIVLSVVVGSLVIIVSEWLVAGQLNPGLALKAYAALINGSVGSFNAIVNTLVATVPLLLGGLSVGLALQGRPVQHRRPGPVPDGRARRRHRRGPAPRVAADHRDPPLDRGRDGRPARSGASSRASSRRPAAPTKSSRRSCSTSSPSHSWRTWSAGRSTSRARPRRSR